MNLRNNLALVLLASVCLTGCSTLSSVKKAEGQGQTRSYHHPPKDVFENARKAVGSVGLTLYESDFDQTTSRGSIIAMQGMTLISYGERVAVFVTPKNAEWTNVEVVSKRVLATNMFAKDWTNEIFTILDALMEASTMGGSNGQNPQ